MKWDPLIEHSVSNSAPSLQYSTNTANNSCSSAIHDNQLDSLFPNLKSVSPNTPPLVCAFASSPTALLRSADEEDSKTSDSCTKAKMAFTLDQLMPVVAPGGFAAPDNEEARFLLRLGYMVFGVVWKVQQPPDNHHIAYKHVLVAEVGSDEFLYVYITVPAWIINGLEIGNYSAVDYLGTARAPTTDNPNNRANLAKWPDFRKYISRIVPDPFFHWDLGDPKLNTTLAKLRQNRMQNLPLEPSLVPPPAKLSRADKKWRQTTNYTQFKAGKIDCTIEVVDRTKDREKSMSGSRVLTQLDNQRALDLHSTFEDVLAHAMEIQVHSTVTGKQPLKSMLAKTGYAIELWVLPQKYDGKVYEWKKDSKRELFVFLDVAVWKEHKQLYIEAHITQGKAKVVESMD